MFNQAILIGNVGKQPERRTTKGGTDYFVFTLATSESWRDQASGERKTETVWHNITVWAGRMHKVCESYINKGDLLTIIGQVRNRSWKDDKGDWHNSSELRATNITLMPNGRGSNNDPGPSEPGYQGGESDGASSQPLSEALDDEVPF